jgi:integrase
MARANLKSREQDEVRANLVGIHTTFKRLADGQVCIYAYAARGLPLLARVVGRDKAAAKRKLEYLLGTREMLDKIRGARDAEVKSRRTPSTRTVSGLVIAYKASPEYIRLGDSSKRAYDRYLSLFKEEFGEDRITMFDDPESVQDLGGWRDEFADTPRTADYMVQAVSRVFSWGRSRGFTKAEPTKDLERLYSSDRSDIIWTDADLAKFDKTAPKHLVNAARLAAYTGLRQGDLLRLKWSSVFDLSIAVRTRKRGKLAVVPLIEPARALLKTLPRYKEVDHVLATSNGTAWTPGGFRASFRTARNEVGINHHFHDLRGTAATYFCRHGVFTNAEIARIMGWSTDRVEQLIALYVSSDAVALDMLQRMKEKHVSTNRLQTASVGSKEKAKKAK